MNGIRITRSEINYTNKFQSTKLSNELKTKLDQFQGGFYPTMTESEAILILDISSKDIKKLDEKLLKRKHRGAMILNHPDKGGSPYLATKINEAREVLERSVLLRKR